MPGNSSKKKYLKGGVSKREGSLKVGIFKSGNLLNGESLKAGIFKMENF